MRQKTRTATQIATTASNAPGTIAETLRVRRKAIAVPELAELLDVSERYLYEHAKNGNIPAMRLPGNMLRFDPAALVVWLEERYA